MASWRDPYRHHARDDVRRAMSGRKPILSRTARWLAALYGEPYSPLTRFADHGTTDREVLAEVAGLIDRRSAQTADVRMRPHAHDQELEALTAYLEARVRGRGQALEDEIDGFER